MTNNISKEEVLAAIVNYHFDDYEFINKINDLTYHRKVALYKQSQINKQTDGKEQND